MALKSVDVRPEPAAAAAAGKLPLKPEDQELARKLQEQAALEAELAERELRAASLRAELSAFERRYLPFVGSRCAELDECKAQMAEQLVREQPGNERVREMAREARARAGQTKFAVGERTSQEPRAFHPSPELKRLYREVAKRVHPDFTSDREDRVQRQELMAKANRAYDRGDEARLARILTDYACSPESVHGDGPGAELIRVIRRLSHLRGRGAEIEAEMQGLMGSELYELKMRVEEAERNGRDVLKELVEQIETQIAVAKLRLANPLKPLKPS
jgi:hypothetical protein